MAIPVFQPQDNPTRTNFNARIEAVNTELAELSERLEDGPWMPGSPENITLSEGRHTYIKFGEKQALQYDLFTDTLACVPADQAGSIFPDLAPFGCAAPTNDGHAATKKYVDEKFDQVEPGEDGKSAYEYAVDGGYTGTEAEFGAMLASGPWLPTRNGIVVDPLVLSKDLNMTGLMQTNIAQHTIVFSPSSTGIEFNGLQLIGDYIHLSQKDTGSQILVSGVRAPVFPDDAANRQYVDDAIASLKQYVDDAIASIGPVQPSGAFAFSVSDGGNLICSYTGEDPPGFQISDDGHLIYSYAGAEPPEYYINENGHLCLEV